MNEDKPTTTSNGSATDNQSKTWMYVLIGLVLLAVVGLAVFGLMTAKGDTTERIRDVFIIFMAVESIIIGAALVILIIQLSALINLLQNEVRPILESTRDTVNTMRGTTKFVGDHFATPVIKANTLAAGVKRFFELLRPWKG